MTKDEFEALYAQQRGITAERLYELGHYAVPCDCKDPSCRGWQMVATYEGLDRLINDPEWRERRKAPQ